MALPNVNITLGNGNIGTVTLSDDGIAGLIVTGTAVSTTLELEKAYVISSTADLKKLGITEENNPLAYKDILAFYTSAGDGAELHLLVTAADNTLTEICSMEDGSPLKKLIDSAAGRIRLVGINVILAVSLNVATGYLGQLPLGHAGFMAVGAYTCALFTKYSTLPEPVAFAAGLALGAAMACVFGILIGIPALRLSGDYLAILTLGFGEIIRITLNNIDNVLGFSLFYGAKGLKNIPKYSDLLSVFLCVVLTCFFIHTMLKSRHGRAVLAIRDNEIAAESCGIQTTYYKVMAFSFSAAFAGLAGGLYAGYLGVLDPASFVGGMGSMLGSILSATVLTILPEALRSVADYRMVLYSIVLILMMIFRPGGLLGSYDFSLSRIISKVLSHGGKEETTHE